MRIACATVLGFVVLGGAPSWAVDGVLEISQTCAVHTGCFPGDSAGFPVTIDGSSGRSVRLTSDLQLPDENTSGILIAADGVTVDLNGFSVRGVTTCPGTPPVCAPTGAGFGIAIDPGLSPRPQRTTLQNGSVTGAGFNGIELGPQSRVDGVATSENANTGILVRSGSIVVASSARANGGIGILAGRGGVISRCTSSLNGASGILTGGNDGGGVVAESIAESNDANGIWCEFACTLDSNIAKDNTGSGILVSAGQAARVSHNTVTGNATGLDLGTGAAYDHNTATANSTTQVSGGFNAGGNYCDGTGTVASTCP